jgi:TFIIS helical bundle-like domain
MDAWVVIKPKERKAVVDRSPVRVLKQTKILDSKTVTSLNQVKKLLKDLHENDVDDNFDRVLSSLKEFESLFISLDILEDLPSLARTISKLSKHKNQQIREISGSLYAKWRKIALEAATRRAKRKGTDSKAATEADVFKKHIEQQDAGFSLAAELDEWDVSIANGVSSRRPRNLN